MSSGLVLNTNINSLVAQNALTTSGNQLSQALEQLSTGLRINTAADDAAGYAISNSMTSQINGLDQAAQNANDGVSLTQTASGALSEIVNDLQSMRDLAVESLNATNSSSDRTDLNAEYQQLVDDVNNVASTTQFNGVNLLDGSFQGATFQIGADAGQTITVSSVASAAANNLGQLYTATSAGATAYTTTGATGGAAVASGDSGTFTLTAGGQTYTTSPVTLTGDQSTDLTTVAAAITQATGESGIVATVNSAGTGINLSSTTGETVNASYTATTGAETLATFGMSAINNLSPTAADTYAATGTAVAEGDTALSDTSSGAVSVVIQNAAGTDTTYTTANIGTGSFDGTAADDAATIATALNATTSFSGAGYSASVNGTGELVIAGGTSAFTVESAAYTPSGETTGTIDLGFGAATAATGTALTAAPTTTLSTSNVLTVDSSNEALIQIDAALQQLATTSADLGAYQNRFQAAVTGLNTDSQNLSSARSQIEDTDYAQATSTLTQAQILQQAGTAMVAQANEIPQNVLTLLNKLS